MCNRLMSPALSPQQAHHVMQARVHGHPQTGGAQRAAETQGQAIKHGPMLTNPGRGVWAWVFHALSRSLGQSRVSSGE